MADEKEELTEGSPDSTNDMEIVEDVLAGQGSEPGQTHKESDPADRAQEIPALLETAPPDDDEQSETVDSNDSLAPGTEEVENSANFSGPQSDPPQPPPVITQFVESPTASDERSAIREDLKAIQASLLSSQAVSDTFSAKLDAITSETSELVQKINGIALNHELMSAELETLATGAGSGKTLSKTFLIISSVCLFLLAGFQMYIFVTLIGVEKLQSTSGPALLENLNGINKKLAEYNTTMSKTAPGHTPQPEAHAQPPADAAQGGHTEHTNTSEHTSPEPAVTPAAAPVPIPLGEKLNRLRNGLPERKLVRKETGDWFVYSKKAEECIADVDIIDALNQAYKRLGRPMTTKAPVPAHNALCILKPDGKGGTQIAMTESFVP